MIPRLHAVRHPEKVAAWYPEIAQEWTGCDAQGWDASIWILHSAYEHRPRITDTTFDQALREAVAAGTATVPVINGFDIMEESIATGIPLGDAAPPEGWTRVRWRDILAQSDDELRRNDVPPCFRWFPSGSFPVEVHPGPEGSMSQPDLAALLAVLARHTAGGAAARCIAWYAFGATRGWDAPEAWRVRLDRVGRLVKANGGWYDNTPSNIWPADRSWFVWTDWDLMGTKVSGSHALIEALRSDPYLETIDWEPPRTATAEP